MHGFIRVDATGPIVDKPCMMAWHADVTPARRAPLGGYSASRSLTNSALTYVRSWPGSPEVMPCCCRYIFHAGKARFVRLGLRTSAANGCCASTCETRFIRLLFIGDS
ncbi:hypothetical protein F441_21624 [Phytophthora nicotianae CJ01A1]|uniref:Uncharacterized protein n=3 Tax=Phytophthora nicotianae TaxID=4792 RepID=W2Y2A0_PHYNI|nr:hypothetical protein L915_21138 [Phytophthora nicotianae]ETP01085.1 hypothetical protein F441_21624 [Phytophthora nicotianae CJ01A1]ETP29230.1 hypothetical protein F442_21598 [Phytophthora nicotianae P10297]